MSFLGQYLDSFTASNLSHDSLHGVTQLGASLSRVYQQMMSHDTGFMTAWKNYILTHENGELDQEAIKEYKKWSDWMGVKWAWDPIPPDRQEEHAQDLAMVRQEIDLLTAPYEVLRRDNEDRQAELRHSLRRLGYGVTDIRGYWIDNYDPSYDNLTTPEYFTEAIQGIPFQEVWRIVPEDSLFVVDLEDTGRLRRDMVGFGWRYFQDSILYVPKGATHGYLLGTNDWGYPGPDEEDYLSYPVFDSQGQYYSRVSGRPFILGQLEDEDRDRVEAGGRPRTRSRRAGYDSGGWHWN